MADVSKIADGLSEAQRRYLIGLELNKVDAAEAYRREIERSFQNRKFRTTIRGAKLNTAWALIRKGIVKIDPQPCECGYHYSSLTPLGLAVRTELQRRESGG